ncbi:hypothetical protein NRB20_55970 [Nocardia sp. RB20]|uniref:ESAT-6-like protein n=2 Tax=Nocardia macrotermitis TaxID=2585198 RepID=A0A7K0DA40_9NOCA|nr:hypothetical protein [Nocardia macrotermitis]
MLYNSNTISGLISELEGYHRTITTERENAQTAATQLINQAWQSGDDGGASAAFHQKHNKLIEDLDGLLLTLSKGITHVNDAVTKAKSTDTKVAGDFTW